MRVRLIFLASLIFCQSSWGFFSLMDTGQVKSEGEYKVLGEGQILFDPPEGFNLNARFATGIQDDAEIQFEAGIGSIDYYLGAFYKWVPFPDTDSQPALGVRGGLTFAEVNNYSTYGANITPLISKMFEANFGKISPYGGVLLGLQNNVNETFVSLQAVIGLEWQPNEWEFNSLKDFNFLLEYGAEIDDAFNYLSFGASYDF